MATRKTSTPPAGSSTDAAAQFQEAVSQTLQGAAERLQSLNLTGAAANLMENGRKDIEALVEANKRSYQGLQTVVQRQTEMLRSSITQWQETVSGMQGQDISANLSKLDEMGRSAFQQALNDMRELAEVAAKSQSEAFDIVRQRIQDNVEQAAKLLQPGGPKK
ncbi:TIGR01841 family phasin [Xenophilus arseniciresistens]|uniref:TIGR01841 family phasin n=1 Tax=Xenophilus arseniciresistens TaxID=1283306 RepID=A0AAE3NCM5_9BURK|nr:TIGR01841 family phasin [Xenophilus arseniciresistens]MDA7419118.1 TIGR01841 family phasin [Xenophilus arseniciresistens]